MTARLVQPTMTSVVRLFDDHHQYEMLNRPPQVMPGLCWHMKRDLDDPAGDIAQSHAAPIFHYFTKRIRQT